MRISYKYRDQITRTQLISLSTVLFITFLFGLYYTRAHLYSTEFGHDEGYYIEMAKRWVDTGVYAYASDVPNAFVPPGLPVYLALCYKLFGFEPTGLAAIRILQLAFSVLTVFLVYIYGYQLSGMRNVGIIAAGLISLNLNFYSYTYALLTENIYFLSMMLFAVAFTYAQKQDKLWLHFVSGLLFCVCVMIRSAIVIVVFVIYIPTIIKNKHNPIYAFKCLGLFVLGFAMLALPWWIRNIVVLDELILFCKQSHIVFAGMAKDIYALGIAQPESFTGCFGVLLELLKRDPVGTIYWFTIGKFEIFFMQYSEDMFSVFAAIPKNIVVFFGIPTCVRALFSSRYRWGVITFFIYLFVVFLGVPTSRYGLQYLFFLSVAAAYALNSLHLAFR